MVINSAILLCEVYLKLMGFFVNQILTPFPRFCNNSSKIWFVFELFMIRINKYACELHKRVSLWNRRFLSVNYSIINYLAMKGKKVDYI